MSAQKKTPTLTIGMANCQDYSGVWFTIQAIRMYHPEVYSDIEFVVLDNSPDQYENPHSKALLKYMQSHYKTKGRYMAVGPRQSTSLRNLIIHAANTEYVMVVDSHIMLAPGSLRKLIAFLKASDSCPDLFHGPLVSESGSIVGTHMNPAFRGENFGTWGTMGKCSSPDEEPFLIPGQGMGLWVCRRDNWPGFHIGYRAFAGEEMIIHEKYRQLGFNVWCLPFLQWVHRFGHVGGAPYVNTRAEKYRNFAIGFQEVGLPLELMDRYYANVLSVEVRQEILREVARLFPQGPKVLPEGYKPFLGYPIRLNDYCSKSQGAYELDTENYTKFEVPIYANSENNLRDADVQSRAAS